MSTFFLELACYTLHTLATEYLFALPADATRLLEDLETESEEVGGQTIKLHQLHLLLVREIVPVSSSGWNVFGNVSGSVLNRLQGFFRGYKRRVDPSSIQVVQ